MILLPTVSAVISAKLLCLALERSVNGATPLPLGVQCRMKRMWPHGWYSLLGVGALCFVQCFDTVGKGVQPSTNLCPLSSIHCRFTSGVGRGRLERELASQIYLETAVKTWMMVVVAQTQTHGASCPVLLQDCICRRIKPAVLSIVILVPQPWCLAKGHWVDGGVNANMIMLYDQCTQYVQFSKLTCIGNLRNLNTTRCHYYHKWRPTTASLTCNSSKIFGSFFRMSNTTGNLLELFFPPGNPGNLVEIY